MFFQNTTSQAPFFFKWRVAGWNKRNQSSLASISVFKIHDFLSFWIQPVVFNLSENDFWLCLDRWRFFPLLPNSVLCNNNYYCLNIKCKHTTHITLKMDDIVHVFMLHGGTIIGLWSFCTKVRLEGHIEGFFCLIRRVRRGETYVSLCKKPRSSPGLLMFSLNAPLDLSQHVRIMFAFNILYI